MRVFFVAAVALVAVSVVKLMQSGKVSSVSENQVLQEMGLPSLVASAAYINVGIIQSARHSNSLSIISPGTQNEYKNADVWIYSDDQRLLNANSQAITILLSSSASEVPFAFASPVDAIVYYRDVQGMRVRRECSVYFVTFLR